MSIKNFNEFNYIKEDWDFDEDDDNEQNWEVIINGEGGSYWEFKYDAIESIVEILDTNGDENGLEGYKDEDDYELSKGEITDMLTDMDEDDFYEKLDELKEFVGYEEEIRLINLDDDDEVDFLD